MNTLQFESRRLAQSEGDDGGKEHDFVDERIALFRPTLDGFVFSDSVPASALHENKDKLRKCFITVVWAKGIDHSMLF